MLLNKYFASMEEKVVESKQEDTHNGEGEMEDLMVDNDSSLTDCIDPELHLELVQLKMELLKVQEEKLQCKQKMLLLNRAGNKPIAVGSSNRCILPDGKIVVRNINDRASESHETEGFGISSGDSNGKHCTCSKSWDRSSSSGDDSTSASTCVLCGEKSRINPTWEVQDKSDLESNITESRAATKTVDLTSKESKGMKSVDKNSDFTSASESRECDRESERLYEFKFSDFVSDEEHDETNRLIQLRNTDYLDIVEEHLKIVVALSGYPKSKMLLKHMEQLQKSLTDIIDMQIKAGLLKTVPSFLDYYLNRGAVVFICKDLGTRDWIVRVSGGLEERMNKRLILLNSKVKRICLAVLKIPQSCWPDTALDVFKLIQYFNPTLRTEKWKIYAQKIIDDIECTSFLIDRTSGEIIRGPTYKNVINYCNMEFDLTGYTEIYYESLDLKDDLSSVASRVKLLKEIRSEEVTPRNDSKINLKTNKEINIKNELIDALTKTKELKNILDITKDLENPLQIDNLKEVIDVDYANDKNKTVVLSVKTKDETSDKESENSQYDKDTHEKDESTSTAILTEKTDSVIESTDDFVDKNRTITIDPNRGIAYNRRTNYLHVDNDLKIAITLDGYPQNKLEGTHIRSLKRLFKEYLHKDVKRRRFNNHIIPKFQDVYLSNGAVVYICDSLETKEYLTEILPKFITATSLKLVFKDVSELLRYTRLVMRLPKELAHLESKEILTELNAKYPGLKLNSWKYYLDVAGKQKREFGVDPESLEIIKRPTFSFSYKGEDVSFRIIDRKGKNVTCSETETKLVDVENFETKALWERISRDMYSPINPDIMSTPLTRVRTKHYSDLIADDLKLYVGPSNYPETRVDEALFFTFKNAMTSVVMDSFKNDGITIPKIHDMYLYDGVIFIICKDIISKKWIQDHIPAFNLKLHMNFKCTEFRGAVGIVRMVVITDRDTDEVISILQKQNPRLRTKYWRKISVVGSKTKLDVVLQIDRLSAQVITSPEFNKYIDSSAVQFELGHLQSLIKPKSSLEYLERKYIDTHSNKQLNTLTENAEIGQYISDKEISNHTTKSSNIIPNVEPETKELNFSCDECPDKDLESHKSVTDIVLSSERNNEGYCRMILKIPTNILPEDKDDFNIILDLLEDKNPGLNTELWKISYDPDYPSKGKFTIFMDKQSASVIRSKAFDSTIGGERLKFFF